MCREPCAVASCSERSRHGDLVGGKRRRHGMSGSGCGGSPRRQSEVDRRRLEVQGHRPRLIGRGHPRRRTADRPAQHRVFQPRPGADQKRVWQRLHCPIDTSRFRARPGKIVWRHAREVVEFAHARIPGSRKFGHWTKPTRFHRADGRLIRDGPNDFRITAALRAAIPSPSTSEPSEARIGFPQSGQWAIPASDRGLSATDSRFRAARLRKVPAIDR